MKKINRLNVLLILTGFFSISSAFCVPVDEEMSSMQDQFNAGMPVVVCHVSHHTKPINDIIKEVSSGKAFEVKGSPSLAAASSENNSFSEVCVVISKKVTPEKETK